MNDLHEHPRSTRRPGAMAPAILAASLAAVAVAGEAQEPAARTEPDLVRNGGFEDIRDGKLAAWTFPAEAYRMDQAVARGGRASLRYLNDDPNRYLLCRQAVGLKAGCRYEVAAWVRTKGIRGEDSGAAVCLEWHDAGGKWLGGYYPEGRKGDTAQWAPVGGISTRVPAGAAGGHVLCYVRKGMTGTAWWDDVSVRRIRERAFHSLLVRPSYRGWVLDDGPSEAEVLLRFAWDDVDGAAEAHRLRARLLPADDDKPLVERTVAELPADELRVRLPLGELKAGDYRLAVELVSKRTGTIVHRDAHRLQRRTQPAPKVYADRHNRLIVDGRPFFPLGMYWGSITAEHLAIFARGPFNCLMPYGRPTRQQMDLAGKLGLKVIYSVKDFYHGTRWCPDFIRSAADEEPAVRRAVRELRDHPALLAWYLNDELPQAMLPRLEAHQRWLEQEDPNHPTWTVLYQVGDVAAYSRSFDVIGTDPYPIPSRPPALAGEWARLTRRGVADARAVWMVPQVFNWGVYRKTPQEQRSARPPTFDEMRSMTWQCIAEGADGIVFYSWQDLHRDKAAPFEKRWAEICRVAGEVKQMAPVLLSAEPTPKVTVDAPAAVHWTVRRRGPGVWVFLVNDAARPAEATVRIAGRPEQRLTLKPLGVEIHEAGAARP